MKPLDWSPEKNAQLQAERSISFEELQIAIEAGAVLDVFPHPNQKKYLDQQFMAILFHDYVYAVAFIEQEQCLFLKTAYPSRKLFKKYCS